MLQVPKEPLVQQEQLVPWGRKVRLALMAKTAHKEPLEPKEQQEHKEPKEQQEHKEQQEQQEHKEPLEPKEQQEHKEPRVIKEPLVLRA